MVLVSSSTALFSVVDGGSVGDERTKVARYSQGMYSVPGT